ncbi:MAG TPA: succinate dehydrogenase cytochrome b subunit [Gemmatimonadales bacterium]|jgi:succinate dehydrogenase / fumarate reductase cytochrome b subunit|nr:succinate dehydrogenase cytochrome b subunit [Gemmatimonadales bacterium]
MSAGAFEARRAASPLRALWGTSIGKKAVMAVTGVIWVAYLITHVLANLTVFAGPSLINRYSAMLHASGPALWAARIVLIAAIVLHVAAAIQLTARRHAARPVGYVRREPQVSTLASRTIRWGGALILVFLVVHLLHFTTGTIHPDFVEGDPFHNVVVGFRNPWMVLFYLIAMAAVGLHLYHGIWSSGKTLGVTPPSPRPLRRPVAAVLGGLIWLGFTLIPIAVYAGLVGGAR